MELSIILTYFKKKKFIKRTLNSIINQTFKNHELIIVYDQKDKTDINFIKRILAKKIKYKIIYNKKNLGVGKSRNIGIQNSKSKYIAFCDADDIWHKKKSEVQLNIMKSKNIKISHTDYYLIDSSNKKYGKMIVKKNLDYRSLIKSCDIGLSSVIIERSLLKSSFKFGSTKTKEDYYLWLKLSKKFKFYGINYALVSWKNTKNSLSSNVSQKFKDAYAVYKKVENRNFLITTFYVLRLSINFLSKKLLQKISL